MKKPKEIEVRIRHHAKKLVKFSGIMKELLSPRPTVKIGVRNITFKNKNGEFVLRGYRFNGEYVGVKLTRGLKRSKKNTVLFMVVE